MRFNAYWQQVAVMTVVLGALLGAVNIGVDPTGSFGIRTQGSYFRADRHAKFHQMAGQRYILFSTSLGFSFDPASISSPRIFNGAQSALKPEETLYYVEEAAQDADFIAIGLDCVSLHLPRDPIVTPGYGRWSADTLSRYGFSMEGLKLSMLTLWHQWRGRPFDQRADGYEDPHWADREAADPAARRAALLAGMTENLLSDSPDRFPYLERIRKVLEQRGTRYQVFLQPISETAMDHFEARGARGRIEQCRARVKSIFPDVLDLSQSEFSANENFYPGDVLHYRPATATAVIRRVFTAGGVSVR